jgi:hypothetical protein
MFGRYLQFLLLTATRRNEAAQMQRTEANKGVWSIPASRMKGKAEHVVFGFEAPDWVDPLSNSLSEAIEFLEQETAPLRKRDQRKAVCALVVSAGYQLVHGTLPPYSKDLGEACEDYWQACGHARTSKDIDGCRENWRRRLVEVKAADDTWPLNVLEEFRSGTRT